jgi:hypothetical protein
MTKAELLADPNSCLNRSADDEPVFLIVARDVIAPGIVEEWALRAQQRGSPKEKTEGAFEIARVMRIWQTNHGTKIPD